MRTKEWNSATLRIVIKGQRKVSTGKGQLGKPMFSLLSHVKMHIFFKCEKGNILWKQLDGLMIEYMENWPGVVNWSGLVCACINGMPG